MQVVSWIKRLIWLYVALLICEGALRRWIIPGFAGPLLLIRDPVAIILITLAGREGLLGRAPLLRWAIVVNVLSFLMTMLFGHRSIAVALYGLRITLVHLPVMFIIGQAFTLRDVVKIGRMICLVAVPMTALIAAQFYLPQSHWVNVGIGGEGTAGFAGVGERFRPPGTFSFTVGLTQFYSVVQAFVIAFALSGGVRRLWWMLSAFSLAMAVPLSISRSLLIQIGITCAALIAAGVGIPRFLPKIAAGILSVALALVLATLLPAFSEPLEAFTQRWDTANEIEGGLVEGVLIDRALGGLLQALLSVDEIPFVGFGLGLGTNAGAALQTGSRAFLVAEGEWLRIVGEMGPLIGLSFIGIRVLLAVAVFRASVRSWWSGNFFPLMLASVACVWLAQASIGQPTTLGFAVVAGGLALAATRDHRLDKVESSGGAGAALEVPVDVG